MKAYFTELVLENEKMEVKSHGQHSVRAASNQMNLMPLLSCTILKIA